MNFDFYRSLTIFLFASLSIPLLTNFTAVANDKNLRITTIQLAQPSDNFTLHAKSREGLFQASLTSTKQAVPLNKMHHWHLKLLTGNGATVSGARIEITGNMLTHSHSLPTSPRVSKELGNGDYLIEGVKFDRQGDWQLQLDIHTAASRDVISFEIPVDVTIWADWYDGWSEDERTVLRSLWIGSLPKPPLDPSNQFADNEEVAEFGHRLFFDTRLSQNGSVACATCHIPQLAFTDGHKLAQGIGETKRNTPTIIGSAYMPWLFGDGRKDSLWSQALGPLENPLEHGTTRAEVIALVLRDKDYVRRYQMLFGPLPKQGDPESISRAFVNLGKAIAAYERVIMPGPTKFDRYVEAILENRKPSPANQLSGEEIAGLKVFISDNQGQCIRCHNGPMFTDNQFHNIGSHLVGENESEQGRAAGILLVLSDETNCRSKFSDIAVNALHEAPKTSCPELHFAKRNGKELLGAFKTPTLRFLAKTAPYMHAGQFETLEDVIWQYRDVPPATIGQTELQQLSMSNAEFLQIEDFLRTLDGPIRAPKKYLQPPTTLWLCLSHLRDPLHLFGNTCDKFRIK